MHNSELIVKHSTRLTEIYRANQQGEPSSPFYPLVGADGKEYIIFSQYDNTRRKFNHCYYREDSDGEYSLHTLLEDCHSFGYSTDSLTGCRNTRGDEFAFLLPYSKGTDKIAQMRIVDGKLQLDDICQLCRGLTRTAVAAFGNHIIKSYLTQSPLSEDYWVRAISDQNADVKDIVYCIQTPEKGWPAYSGPWRLLLLPDASPYDPRLAGTIMVTETMAVPLNGEFFLPAYLCGPETKKIYLGPLPKAGTINPIYYGSEAIVPISVSPQETYLLFTFSQPHGAPGLWLASYDQSKRQIREFVQLSDQNFQDMDATVLKSNGKTYLSIVGSTIEYDDYTPVWRVTHCLYNTAEKKLEKSCMPIAIGAYPLTPLCDINEKEHTIYYMCKKALHRLVYNIDEDEWDECVVADSQADAPFRKVTVYEHRMKVTDADGFAMTNVPVKIWTNTSTSIQYAEKHYSVGPDRPVTLKTDQKGMVVLYHETQSLSDVDIQFEVGNGVQKGGQCISAAEYQRKRLKNLEANKLKEARDSNGNYILSPKHRSDDLTLKAVTQSIRDVTAGPKNGLLASGHSGFIIRRMEDGLVRRAEITGAEFDALYSEFLSESNGLFSSIGSFFKALAAGFVKVMTVAVKAVVHGLETVVNFVIDGVKKMISFVTDTVQRVVEAVECLFSLVIDALDPLFDWLGELIGLESIKRSQAAVQFVLEQGVAYIKKESPNKIRELKQNLHIFAEQVDNALGDVYKSLGNKTFDALQKQGNETVDACGSPSPAENYLMDAFTGSADSFALIFADGTKAETAGPLENFLAELKDLTSRAQTDQAYLVAFENLKTLSVNQQSFMKSTLVNFLQAVSAAIHLTIRMIGDACESICEKGIELLEDLIRLLKKPLTMPWIDLLFKKMFKQDLSVWNLTTMLIAMSVNASMKITSGHVPFETENRLTEFKTECGKIYNKTVSPAERQMLPVEPWVEDMFRMFSCGCQVTVYAATAFSDANPANHLNVETDSLNRYNAADAVAVLGNTCWIIFSVPAFYDTDRPLTDWGKWMICILNDFVSGAFLVSELSGHISTREDQNTLAVIGGLLGCFYLVCNIIGWAQMGVGDGMLMANEILLSLQSIGRFLTIPALVQKTGLKSLIIELALDAVCGIFGFCLLFWNPEEKQMVPSYYWG